MNPAAPEPAPRQRWPFWTYEDLALFVAAVLPSLALGALALRVSRLVAPAIFRSDAASTLAFQLYIYAFLLGALFLLISWKYGQPFWSSLGWTLRFKGALVSIILGPTLAVATSVLGVLLRAPQLVDDPIRKMITGRASLAVVTVFGVVAAPFVEEILFRGFLFPLFEKSLGPGIGILLTTIPFALLHGPQNEWAWQQITLIALAGAVFGYARYKTGSTAAAYLLHASYNAAQFAGYVLMTYSSR